MKEYLASAEDVLHEQSVEAESGLTSGVAAQRLSEVGPNKLDEEEKRAAMLAHPDAQPISALDGQGIRALLYRIAQEAASGSVTITVLVPYEKGLLMKMVHERCQVMRESFVQQGLLATVKADRRMAATLEPYRVDEGGLEECPGDEQQDGLVDNIDEQGVPSHE